MHTLETVATSCPYCGEPISLLVDCSVEFEEYIEDCSVCCRPIEIFSTVDTDGTPTLTIKRDSD